MKQENHKEYNMTNETKLDLTEIKNILVTIQKKINIIEKSLEEDYMNDKIIAFYNNEQEEPKKPSNDELYSRLQKIDDLMNFYIEQKKSFGKKNAKIQAYCDRTLEKLHDEYCTITLLLDNDEEK